jgi:hypothetical protein
MAGEDVTELLIPEYEASINMLIWSLWLTKKQKRKMVWTDLSDNMHHFEEQLQNTTSCSVWWKTSYSNTGAYDQMLTVHVCMFIQFLTLFMLSVTSKFDTHQCAWIMVRMWVRFAGL